MYDNGGAGQSKSTECREKWFKTHAQRKIARHSVCRPSHTKLSPGHRSFIIHIINSKYIPHIPPSTMAAPRSALSSLGIAVWLKQPPRIAPILSLNYSSSTRAGMGQCTRSISYTLSHSTIFSSIPTWNWNEQTYSITCDTNTFAGQIKPRQQTRNTKRATLSQ